ncbi:Modifier of rudimentary Modr [Venturia nashicola]|uniref:Modifier of rudimentary Modr n=1 Tax=Venturia nashicola TaxID=86259 RepID=A0A4Z1P1L9_9PEZI|nr:Modifier of rudimentary Modr [Venturia nashicola]TLD34735.1 Modifier of rudimentary Modr [Venturia nashicola]
MATHSPHQSQNQFQFDTSAPPPPPPKPAYSSGSATPQSGPPRPPPPPGQSIQDGQNRYSGVHQFVNVATAELPPPEHGWLPDIVKDKTTTDLQNLVSDLALQQALVQSPSTAHPSLPASTSSLQTRLSDNLALANSLKALETRIQSQRQVTQSRLLTLRALERQWQTKQSEQDTALRDFSPPALYTKLNAGVGEQDALCRGLEESFLEGEGGGGKASEREVSEFVRRLREARKVGYLRRERKERWDEGRIGGWR